jgi:hypothetical protein
LQEFLEKLDLMSEEKQYFQKLTNKGYDTISDLNYARFEDLISGCGMKRPHARMIFAAVEKLEQERQQAMAAARGVRDIRIEGQQQGDPQHDSMGMFELVEGKEVNGRGVWQMAGGEEHFMYYASNKKWGIGGRAMMEAGKNVVLIYVASTALTPAQATETWQVWDGTAWPDALKVTAHVYTLEEKRAAVEKLEQERQQAMVQARETRSIMLEGQQQGDPQHDSMGLFELMEGREVNGRGVWQMEGGQERFMYYGSKKQWSIGGREGMEAGTTAAALIYVASTALTPDQIIETWIVWDGTALVNAPKMRVCLGSAEAKMLEDMCRHLVAASDQREEILKDLAELADALATTSDIMVNESAEEKERRESCVVVAKELTEQVQRLEGTEAQLVKRLGDFEDCVQYLANTCLGVPESNK